MRFGRTLTSILASGLIAFSAFGEEKGVYRELYEKVEKMGGKFEYKDNISYIVRAENSELIIGTIIGNIFSVCIDNGCDGLDDYKLVNLDDFNGIKHDSSWGTREYLHRTKQLLSFIERKTRKDIF